jgi:glycosyltransferase involved in cell wall biosynthesis
MMKILFILELYHPNIGGIEKLFKSLAERLAAEGHEVKVITSRFRKGLPARETINGVMVKRLRISSRFAFTFFGIFGMLREARHCHIIHTTSFNAAFPARLAGLIAGKKVIITFHEAWGKLWFRLPFTGMINKILYYLYESFILHLGFYRYIAVSDYTEASLRRAGIAGRKIVRIYNGLEYRLYDPNSHTPPEKGFVFTYFGRPGISKGLDLIMKAAPGFMENHEDAFLKLIIPAASRKMMKKIGRFTEGLPEGRCLILQKLNETSLRQELATSSCVMIPSYSEGFCFAAAECAALGIPVVSSGQGALAEVVSGTYIVMDDFNGKGLARALEKAYRGEWTISPLKRFPFDDTIRQYLSLYHELTEKASTT